MNLTHTSSKFYERFSFWSGCITLTSLHTSTYRPFPPLFYSSLNLTCHTSHAWLETAQFSSFGPKVPTLQYIPFFLPFPPLNLITLSPPNSVLMQWAEGGSLDDFINIRLGCKPSHIHIHAPGSTDANYELGTLAPPPLWRSGNTAHTLSASDLHSRSARIRAFRAFQCAGGAEGERERERETRKRNGKWTAVHFLSADEVKGLFKDVMVGLGFFVSSSCL